MTVRENKPVPVKPIRMVRVDVYESGPQSYRNVGHAHRHTRMSAVGLLDCVHCQRLDGVDS